MRPGFIGSFLPARLGAPALNVDIWADIKNWPIQTLAVEATNALAPTDAPNGGTLGGYWQTASAGGGVGTEVLVEASGGPSSRVLRLTSAGDFHQARLYALSTDNASYPGPRWGVEKHHALLMKWDDNGSQAAIPAVGLLLLFSQLIDARFITPDDFNVQIGGASCPKDVWVYVYWGWTADGTAYLRTSATPEATVITPGGDLRGIGDTDTDPEWYFGFGQNWRVSVEVAGFARSSQVGSKSYFQAWFAAQFS